MLSALEQLARGRLAQPADLPHMHDGVSLFVAFLMETLPVAQPSDAHEEARARFDAGFVV